MFLTHDAPRYFIAFGVHLGCYTAMTIAVIFLRFYLKMQNKKKDQLAHEAGVQDSSLSHAFEDRTDQENIHFRYIY